jgi:hypothetical protein
MENRAIEPLERLAGDIADLREQRAALLEEEHALTGKVGAAMKQFNKTRYAHDGVVIRRTPGEDIIRISVKKKPDADQPKRALGPD